ncbi:hypothetical protein [Andreesenia angusta]|nr:hypothetical protein [Andreesenia angusta]
MDKQILELLQKMDSRLEEHSQILRALDERTELISAEVENLKHEVAETKGEVKSLRKDLNAVELITANNWSDIVRLKALK